MNRAIHGLQMQSVTSQSAPGHFDGQRTVRCFAVNIAADILQFERPILLSVRECARWYSPGECFRYSRATSARPLRAPKFHRRRSTTRDQRSGPLRHDAARTIGHRHLFRQRLRGILAPRGDCTQAFTITSAWFQPCTRIEPFWSGSTSVSPEVRVPSALPALRCDSPCRLECQPWLLVHQSDSCAANGQQAAKTKKTSA